MIPRKKTSSGLFGLLLFLLSGCQPSPLNTLTPSEAQKKVIKILQEEYQVDHMVTRETGRTVWIYLPLGKPLFDIAADPAGKTPPSEKATKSFSLQFIKAQFEQGKFMIKYDIAQTNKYSKDPGYTTAYTEDAHKLQNGLLTAVYRSYGEASDPPDFFNVVIADIKKGIELQLLFYFPDLKKMMSPTQEITQEEFILRYITKFSGDKEIIGDKNGRHLSFAETAWPEFLSRQIENRINFKYERSSFPPGDDVQQLILTAVNETLNVYHFKDFQSVTLVDLATEETRQIPKAEIF